MQTRYEIIELNPEWRNETQTCRVFHTWEEAERVCAFLNMTKRPRRFWVRECRAFRITGGTA